MAKAPTTGIIAAELTVPERVLLFCSPPATDWVKAGVTYSKARDGNCHGKSVSALNTFSSGRIWCGLVPVLHFAVGNTGLLGAPHDEGRPLQ
jgi:hypothetical protein